jgi:hypothetical protein
VRVIIDDPSGIRDGYGLQVRYRGQDVTRSFLQQARVSRTESSQRLVVEVPAVRLSASDDHLIEIGYRNPAGQFAATRYPSPVCRAFDHTAIRTTDDFRPDSSLLKSIEVISRQMGFSSAFTAALIAQESAFDPKSVSLARALGLTQITPIAETEVSGAFEKWPRYPGGHELPAPILKLLVMAGQIHAGNEWRLDPERSIQGGLTLVQSLSARWLDSESFSKVQWTTGDSDVEITRTRLVLASYHSGFLRVTRAIDRYGSAWLTSPELKAARKYVNRVFSYCDAFQLGRENEYENET